nr:Uncharacterised protein [Klebsiella pneumoniae]
MATILAPSHPQFVFVFAAVRRADRQPVSVCSAPSPGMNTPHAFPSSAITSSRLPGVCRWRRCAHETARHHRQRPRMPEHLRNVGQFVGELMQVQDCTSLRRDPTQQLQLTSVIYLMTAQLDGVVERCNHRWFTGEGNV